MAVGPSAAQGTPARWVLVYTGGPQRPAYSTDDLIHLLAVVDTSGRPTGRLCDGVMLVEYEATSGRYYMPWPNGKVANGDDWTRYLDSLFQRGGALIRLDSATAAVERALGNTGGRTNVVVMVPYPPPSKDTLRFEGRSYPLDSDVSRAAAAGAFIHSVRGRIDSMRLAHLTLSGFYWMNEGITAADTALLPQVASNVHALGLRFYWIPSFDAPGAARWHALGFDDAWLQPNYFFHPDVPATRLDSALARAETAGMGIELELDRRMFGLFGGGWQFADRVLPYLSAIEASPALRQRSIAIYDGGGALQLLARSRDAWHRAMYERLVDVLTTSRQAGKP
jgi:uncharacterized protein DUF4855